MFSTVRLISFLINGKPSVSKSLFIYYHLDLFKKSEPKLMCSHSISIASFKQDNPP